MACYAFNFTFLGQMLLDDGSSPRSHKLVNKQNSFSSPPQQSFENFSSLLVDGPDRVSAHASTTSPQRRSSSVCTLHPIREDEEGEGDAEDEDDDKEGLVFDAPFLRLFKSCFVQFAYMMPIDKAPKSPPASPR